MVTFRSGWAKAQARPWNTDVDDASLRLVRGSVEFLDECVEALCGFGVGRVLSPPLDRSQSAIWVGAGFEPDLPLDVHARSLVGPLSTPVHAVTDGLEADWAAAVEVDDASFDDRWRMGELGLREAKAATARSAFLVVHEGSRLVGFVIVGAAATTAYLQRLAVAPSDRGVGIGRSLVRAASRWGAAQGATSIVLNTQPDNVAAAALYAAEGFEARSGLLSVYARGC